jgi:LDH2 family malate/lactate/ureidoglycolate dehydrogenase
MSDRDGTALVDGDNALGHPVMKRAELAIEKTRQCFRQGVNAVFGHSSGGETFTANNWSLGSYMCRSASRGC